MMQCAKRKTYNEAYQKFLIKHKHFQFFHIITSKHYRMCHRLLRKKNTENATRIGEGITKPLVGDYI